MGRWILLNLGIAHPMCIFDNRLDMAMTYFLGSLTSAAAAATTSFTQLMQVEGNLWWLVVKESINEQRSCNFHQCTVY